MSRPIEIPDKLLDLIYDAATDERLWTPALTEIADLSGGVGGIIFGADNKVRLIEFSFVGRLCQDTLRAYRERHVFNPLAACMKSSPVGKIVCSDDLMSLPELQRTAVFDEVFRPQDVAHLAMVPLVARGDFQTGFTICRSARQGPYDARALRFFSQLYPHLRRSLLLAFRLDGYKALQRAEFSVIDRLSVGIFLIDRSAKVIFANTAARAMAERDGPLQLRHCMLTAASTKHTQRLNQLIQAALRGAPTGTMSLPHPDDGRLLTVLVSSVRSQDIDRFGALGMRDLAAIVFVSDPARPVEIPIAWVMDAYGLTQAEAKVALCAASAASIPETAARLNVSPNTVKTHLRQVFAKTGASRQAELARLIASLGLLSDSGADLRP